jgi:hypothetical protein
LRVVLPTAQVRYSSASPANGRLPRSHRCCLISCIASGLSDAGVTDSTVLYLLSLLSLALQPGSFIMYTAAWAAALTSSFSRPKSGLDMLRWAVLGFDMGRSVWAKAGLCPQFCLQSCRSASGRIARHPKAITYQRDMCDCLGDQIVLQQILPLHSGYHEFQRLVYR